MDECVGSAQNEKIVASEKKNQLLAPRCVFVSSYV